MRRNQHTFFSEFAFIGILFVSLGLFSLGAVANALAGEAGKGARYPARPIKIMIPAAAGGGLGGEIRAIAPFLEKNLGVSLVIDYIPTADGIVAYNKLSQVKPDGYNLGYFNLISALPLELTRETAKFAVKNYTLIGAWNVKYQVLLVHPDNWKTFDEFVSSAKQRTLSLGGTGGHTIVNVHVLESALGVKFNRVPFRSAGEGMAAVAGKHVDCAMTYEGAPKPMIQAGKLRALAILSLKTDPILPDIPDLKKLRYENVTIIPSYGLMAAPPNVPKEIAAILQKALRMAVTNPEFLKIADHAGIFVDYQPMGDLQKAILAQYSIMERYKDFIK